MHSFCVHVLGLSEDEACKRIRVARLAREFPAVFTAVADGSLSLSTALLLAPRLTPDTVDDLLTAAARKSRSDVQLLLAQRFPKPDVPTRIEPLAPSSTPALFSESSAPESPAQSAPGRIEVPRPRMTPLTPERYAMQFTVSRDSYETFRRVQALLSHQVPSGDVAEVFDRAMRKAEAILEKEKYAATDHPRRGRQRASANPRHIPAHVRRAVRKRDGDQCTFVNDAGERCPARKFLEFDHIDEVARGGEATTDRMRLRCRPHNQYEAERTFGTGFMERKRDEARHAAAERRVAAEQAEAMEHEAMERTAMENAAIERAAAERIAAAHAAAERVAAERAESERTAAAKLDVVPYLRKLGFRAKEAQLAAQQCETSPDTPLEERVRAALKFLGSGGRTYIPQAARSSDVSGFATP